MWVCKAQILPRSSLRLLSVYRSLRFPRVTSQDTATLQNHIDSLCLPLRCPSSVFLPLFGKCGWENGGGEGIFLMFLGLLKKKKMIF